MHKNRRMLRMSICDLMEPMLEQDQIRVGPDKQSKEAICAALAIGVLIGKIMKCHFEPNINELEIDALQRAISKNPSAKKLVTQMIDDGTAYNNFKEAALEQIPENMRDDLPQTMPEFCRNILEMIFHPYHENSE